MWTICVSYDLRQPGRDYASLYEYLRSFEDWCHPVQSVWLVKTDKSPEAVVNEARRHMDSNDGVLAVRAAAPGAWAGLEAKVSDWLKTSL